MTSAPAAITPEANIFQKYLIPPESRLVRYYMQKAGVYANYSHFFYSHCVSVGCAVAAVALSLFNIISYFLQIPFKILLKIAQFDPIGAIVAPMRDLINTVRSLVFVSMGATFIAAGILFPKAIFTHFSPEYYESLVVRQKQDKEQLQKINQRLMEEDKRKDQLIDEASTTIQNLERENDDLKHPIRKWWRWCC